MILATPWSCLAAGNPVPELWEDEFRCEGRILACHEGSQVSHSCSVTVRPEGKCLHLLCHFLLLTQGPASGLFRWSVTWKKHRWRTQTWVHVLALSCHLVAVGPQVNLFILSEAGPS